MMERLNVRLQSFNVSSNDEQSLPGSQAQTQAQASSSSSRRNYSMRAMSEEASNGMNRPMRANTLSASPSYKPSPNRSANSSPGPSPISPISPITPIRKPFRRVHSMPINNFNSWVIEEDARRDSTFSSMGVFGNGAATSVPLSTRLQTPVQSPVRNRLGVETSSLSQPVPPRSKERTMRELLKPLEQRTSARRREKVARRAQDAVRVQEREMISKNRKSATRTWVREQQKIARDCIIDRMKQAGDPRHGMISPTAVGAGDVPLLSVSMEEDGFGYDQVPDDPGHTSSLDGNVSGSDHMEIEDEKSESLQGNVSSDDDEEMGEGPSPDRRVLFQAGLAYYAQIGITVPPKTESLDVNLSDDDQMEE